MKAQRFYIDGIALWTPALPGWQQARAAFCGSAPPATALARPNPPLLRANERRRAPDSVLVALEVAAAAVAMAGADAATLASVFTSAHGDSGIVDTMCSTLASDPLMLSPTRFHHSVHNAVSGYWAMANGCHAPSTAVSGFDASFALGLIEAASQLAADAQPVLLAGVDTEARGPLAVVNRSRGLLGVALVLSPKAGPRSLWALDWSVSAGSVPLPACRSEAARALAGNAMADALPLFEALATMQPGSSAQMSLPLGPTGVLALSLCALTPQQPQRRPPIPARAGDNAATARPAAA